MERNLGVKQILRLTQDQVLADAHHPVLHLDRLRAVEGGGELPHGPAGAGAGAGTGAGTGAGADLSSGWVEEVMAL